MKTRIAMMISIAGVLVAGSAAALVNTQVLGGSTAPSGLAADAAPQSEQTIPTTTAATAATVPTTSVVTTVPVVVPAQPAAAPASTQAIYEIGTSGTVTLDTAGDVLTIVSVTPSDGWVVSKSENQDATNVEIKFQSGSVETEFHANLLFGVVTTSVGSNDASSTSNSVEDNHGGSGRGGGGGGSDDSGGGGSDD
jgi:uncharacterized membrane protein YgcG